MARGEKGCGSGSLGGQLLLTCSPEFARTPFLGLKERRGGGEEKEKSHTLLPLLYICHQKHCNSAKPLNLRILGTKLHILIELLR